MGGQEALAAEIGKPKMEFAAAQTALEIVAAVEPFTATITEALVHPDKKLREEALETAVTSIAEQLAEQFPEQAAELKRRASGTLPADLAAQADTCLLYTSPSPRDRTRSRMPSSA